METKQLVLKYYVQKKWVIWIQWILSSKHKINITIEEIKDYIKEFNAQWITSHNTTTKDLERADGWLKEIVKSVEQDRKYDYNPDTGHVILYIDDIPHPLLVTTLDEIIASFSSKGKNFSSQRVQYEFQLTPKVWNKIKSTFKIYKDTVPFSIITMLDIPEGKFEDVAQEKAEQLVESKMNRIYSDTEQRLKDRMFRNFARAQKWYDVFLEQLEEKLINLPHITLDRKLPKVNNTKVKDVFITDAHIGKKWTDHIIERFKKLTRDLINTEEKYINLTFWWDLGECFLPDGLSMHPWQKIWMETISVSDLIILIVDVFQNMLVNIANSWKIVSFNGMKWNHDRFSEKHDFDAFREPALIVYKFLQKLLEKTNIKINIFNDKSNTIKSWKIKYVMLHWDWLSPAELNRRALAEKEDWYYLVFCSWDKHFFRIQELSDSILRVQSPALAWAGRYDESLALSSLPWAIEFTENEDGLVNLSLKRYR